MDDFPGHSSAGSGDSGNIGNINGGSTNTNGNTKKVGKFLPKNLAAKTRWRKPSKESFGSTASSEEDPRGRALTRDAAGFDGSIASLSTAATQSSHELDKFNDASLLIDAEEYNNTNNHDPTAATSEGVPDQDP